MPGLKVLIVKAGMTRGFLRIVSVPLPGLKVLIVIFQLWNQLYETSFQSRCRD
ncbi:hypothetical protein NIES2104_08290 [Leptolyngbya sp. NIES-2104]|nr:hypothetical protein NIES2104_08290 [Leptolyngbya sp. NIES-2104]